MISIYYSTKWKNQEPDTEIKKRLKKWKEEHGFLPLENVRETPKTKAKAKQPAQAPMGTGASSSNEPPKKTEPEPKKVDDPQDDEDLPQYQAAPITAPSRVSLTTIRKHLSKAYNNGLITEQSDKDTWNRYKDFKELKKMKIKGLKRKSRTN